MRILEGVADLPTWDAVTLQGVVGELRRRIPEAHVEWGLGEGWCLVVLRGELVAALRAPTAATHATRFAFVLAGSAVADELREVLRRADAHLVDVEDFEAVGFSMDPDDFVVFAGLELPPEEAFDPTRFAANDLVFVTT